jgi:LCP family protein required for cell wall assembly
LYVTLPGLYQDRINSAQYRGGFTLMADTLEFNFGVRPDYYGIVNFYGFQSLIDTLNGVDVEVAQTLTDHRTGYGDYTVYPGTVHMDGETALWYVRSRYSSNDFDRTRRQQEVVFALMRRLVSFQLVTKFPQLYNQFQDTIETNLPLSEIIPLLPVADNLFRNEIGRYAVGPSHVSNWVTPGGAQVLIPNKPAIQALLKVALNAE